MRLYPLCCLLLLAMTVALAQQSNNTILHAVPPGGKVVVDGKLNEWDLSGQIDVYANYRTRMTYSTQVAAMYDKDYLYLAVLWRDPTPMYNMVDARFDIGSGWKSDCLQLRFKTDMVIHADCWYSTAAQRPVINIAYGRWSGGSDKIEDADLFTAIPDAMKIGALEAFQMGEDKKSYVQEIALPWKIITAQNAIVKATGKPYKEARAFKPGEEFNMGMEFLWGPADGRTFPVHRYADLLKAGTSSREFFWTAQDAWGPVVLEPTGNLKLEKSEAAESMQYLQKTAGPVKLQYTMPYDGYVTLVVEDAKGCRVKNLIGMAPRSKGKQVDYWDGTDEQGKLVTPGTYRWRGLYHQGIDPAYEASYGSPGVPPWDTADGSGAWMSDHNPPVSVAAAKDTMILVSAGSEAGWAMVATDLNGRKKWGERKFQAISDVASDGTHVYAGMDSAPWAGILVPKIGRLEAKTGKYAPFNTAKGDALMVDVATEAEKASLTGIAVSGNTLAVSLAGSDEVRFFNSTTMERIGQVAVAKPGGLAYAADGTLYVISGTQVLKVVKGAAAPLITTGLAQPIDVAVDAQGRLFITDRGAQQVKVFSAAGAALPSIGVAGGRPEVGKWVPNGMRNPRGIAIDVQGRIWVAEENMWPKRVSVWNADGQLVKDMIGPATYGGMGAVVDPQDKTRVFGNGCEFKLDYENNQATVVASVLGNNLVGDLVKFQGREYYMSKRNELYLRKGDALVPVARFDNVRLSDLAKSGLPITALPAGAKDGFTYLWSDLNDDGAMQAEEFATGLKYALDSGYWGGYWLDEQFNIVSAPGGYGQQIVSMVPVKGFTKGGAPIWDAAGQQLVADRVSGGPNKLFLAADGLIIAGTHLTGMTYDGTVRWTYKDNWGDVHGSHLAPIPERDDLLVGTLSCIGTANTPLGKVFAMNSNMGRLFVFTADGLFLASVFQDCRIGSDPWPNEMKKGAPLGGVTMGGEWFGGYFFKAEQTNEFYLIAGGTSYNLIKLNGFETLTPISTQTINFSANDFAAAEKLQQQRAAAAAAGNNLTIAKLATAPTIDGKLNEYAPAQFVEWSSGQYKARGAVATDGTRLFLAYDVSGDANPMVNGGQDISQLFITGDSVDLQLGTDPAANTKRTDGGLGDLRLLISVLDNKPVAVLYRWKTAEEKRAQTFSSPWRKVSLDWVEPLKNAEINIVRRNGGYTVEAAIPLQTLGFTPMAGKAYKLDLGAIFSDPTGTNRAARVYWANKATGLVNDVPGEIMATPNLWGTAKLAD